MFHGLLERLLKWVFFRLLKRLLRRLLGRLPIAGSPSGPKARLVGRAFVFWGLVLVAVGALALTDGNPIAAWLCALLLPASPASIGFARRLALAALSVASVVIGPPLLLLGIPLALAMSGLGVPALASLGALPGAALLYPLWQSLPSDGPLTVPVASFAFLAVAAWSPGLVFLRTITPSSLLPLFLLPVGTALVLAAAAGYWIGPSLFSDPGARLVFALVPVVVAAWSARLTRSESPSIKWVAVSILIGALAVAFVPNSSITEVVFDEGHGKWETVQASFGPEDFGRAANYTYSQLFLKAERVVGKSSVLESEDAPLPGTDSLLVIKMPAEPFSEAFSARVADWVEQGGRLLLVADHTDLYDTTQHSNALLFRHFGVRINTDAAYNPIGMPAQPVVAKAGALLGRIDAHGRQFSWQTGASFQRIPLGGVELMTYGPSFAEPGDYSRPNRFGPFVPELTKRFFNHSAVVAVPHGQGAIAVLLDSTPWSNFSIFREQYSQMLRGLVGALEHPAQLRILGTGAIVLVLLASLTLVLPVRFVSLAMGPALGFVFGAALSAGFAVGSVSWSKHEDGRDFGLRVAAGPEARMEFLKQILMPGERNYARIISAMGKYGLMPLASAPGAEVPELATAKRWLLVEPSAAQLPRYADLLAHLRQGGDLAILFAPDQATDPAVMDWLRDWGLLTQRSLGLSVFDGMKSSTGSLIGGRSPALSREIRVVSAPRSTSLLNPYAADQFLQTYSLRPTKFPRESGLLTIGFSAEQFSDDAVGEVWEGIYPSSLGRLRERLLAAVLLGEERPPLMPAGLVRAQRAPGALLPAFLVLENGETKLEGKFGPEADDDATSAYFRDLRGQAVGFIAKQCPSTGKLTQCADRLLGEDMVEWLVSWRTSSDGKVLAIELLHERRMSGLGSTWNVLFGK